MFAVPVCLGEPPPDSQQQPDRLRRRFSAAVASVWRNEAFGKVSECLQSLQVHFTASHLVFPHLNFSTIFSKVSISRSSVFYSISVLALQTLWPDRYGDMLASQWVLTRCQHHPGCPQAKLRTKKELFLSQHHHYRKTCMIHLSFTKTSFSITSNFG